MHVGQGQRPWALILTVLVILAGGVAAILTQPKPPKPITTELVVTVADLVPVHTQVTARGETVRELFRLAEGDAVETDAGGRARVRLDSGATAVLDGGTKLTVTASGLALERGRIFVQGSSSATEVDLGAGSVKVVGSALGIERREKTKVYCASGEITARAGGKEAVVRTGETADFTSGLAVGPERGFDDWTGGLAAPWAATGAPRRTVGEMWGRAQPGTSGSPLTIRTHDVRAKVLGEVAQTTVKTTFFNAGETVVLGDYRMGVPPGAIVSAFSVARGDQKKKGHLALAKRGEIEAFEGALSPALPDLLEWAGEGWVRGTVRNIPPGQTVTVEVQYVEWLPVREKGDRSGGSQVVQYRFPLTGEAESPTIGDFFLSVDAGPAGATALAAGMGAAIKKSGVELKKSDFHPSADFVVDIEIPKPLAKARGFVGEDPGDGEEATFVVRTEAPRLVGTPEEGVTLAIVLDTSASVDPALLDAGRAFVEALTKSLSDKDRIVVLASDATTRAVGPAELGRADAARREAILRALGEVSRGGATDLGRALEAAADRLPEDAPSGMVVYVGDGWPSVGDKSAEQVRARLARRRLGVPRVGAILVGPSTNRRAFAELVRGSGPLVEVADSEDAARASVELLSRALVPTVTGVRVDLGPDVTQIYPRAEVAVAQGSTLLVVGKLSAADPPKSLKLAYRQGAERKTEERAIEIVKLETDGDLERRWADARAQAMALAGRGREAVTDASLKVGLLTPWTAWITGNTRDYAATSFETRVLELGTSGAGFDVEVAGDVPPASALAGGEDVWPGDDATLDTSLYLAAIRTLEEARGQLRACRDSRAALRPDLPPAVQVRFTLDGDGAVKDVAVDGAGDELLATCIVTVVSNLPYPRLFTKVEVKVSHSLVWPPIETLRGKTCSPTSTLGVPQRRGVWRERLDRMDAFSAYREAKRGCELGSWSAKRSMLELALSVVPNRTTVGRVALELARQLEASGDAEAAAFLKREALRRSDPVELRQVRRMLLAQERLPVGEFNAQYEKATSDKDRLAVVKKFLTLAPHDPRLRGRLLALLAALGDKDGLRVESAKLRSDPFVDAVLIADAAHLLRAIGDEAEAKRAYGEIAERASGDPWAHALLGDRLRGEGWFDDATAVYEALESLVPGDAATGIRAALAHAGAQRLDVALRLLGRVARTGGRNAEPQLALIADRLADELLLTALAAEGTPEGDKKRLAQALSEMPPLPPGTPFLVEGPPGVAPVSAWIERGPEKAREIVRAEAVAGRIGLLALLLEPDQSGPVTLSLGRERALPPAEPFVARVHALVGGKLVTARVELPLSGERVEVAWDGATFGAPRTAKPPAKN